MGYNDENAKRLVFDIETAPLPDASGYLEPVEPPSNYKDPVKIEAYVKEKAAEQLDRCGLDVDLCRIVAIGWQLEGEAPLIHTIEDATESQIILAFWRMAADRHLVGFNCLGFDLPVLLRRSLYLGIQRPSIQIDKYKHPRVTDLSDELSFAGKLKLRSLAFYCKRFGIDIEDSLTGADIAYAVKEGRWTDIESHCRADIEKTSQLAEKLGLFAMEVGAL